MYIIAILSYQKPFMPVDPSLDTPKQDLLQHEGPLPSTEPPCDYPFENLVLSGGGIRGYAYIGAVQVGVHS